MEKIRMTRKDCDNEGTGCVVRKRCVFNIWIKCICLCVLI